MKIEVLVTWNATPWYIAGEKLFYFDWNHSMIPLENQKINIYNILKSKNLQKQITEHFKYNEKQYNVFEWIEKEHFWQVENITWYPPKKDVTVSIKISDAQYNL